MPASDLEFRAKIADIASDSSLDPVERIKRLREMREQTQNVELIGQVEGYIGSLELRREALAIESGVQRVALRENANIRDSLIASGQATAEELDAAGYLSHAELDAREADGSLQEAIDLTLEEMGAVRNPLRWGKGFQKGGEFKPTRGGDAGRRIVKAIKGGRDNPMPGKVLPNKPSLPLPEGKVSTLHLPDVHASVSRSGMGSHAKSHASFAIQDAVGESRNASKELQVGDSLKISGGHSITRIHDEAGERRFRVEGPEVAKQPDEGLSGREAMETALRASAASTHPDSIGGAKSYELGRGRGGMGNHVANHANEIHGNHLIRERGQTAELFKHDYEDDLEPPRKDLMDDAPHSEDAGKTFIDDGGELVDSRGRPKKKLADTSIADSPEYSSRVKDKAAELRDISTKATTPQAQSPGTGSVHKLDGKEFPVLPDGRIDVKDDVAAAAKLLQQGERVNLKQPDQVTLLLNELQKIVAEAKAQKEAAPNFNLCNVTVSNTNLFCEESKGIPRVNMPQLAGFPKPGSKADKLADAGKLERSTEFIDPDTGKGGVDMSQEFVQHLLDKGYKIKDDTMPASHLRATQNELNGRKIAEIAEKMKANPGKSGPPTLVSEDNYIVDGHHRVMAAVGNDAEDGVLGNEYEIPVQRVDIGIIDLLAEAHAYAEDMGFPVADVADNKGGSDKKPDAPEVPDAPKSPGVGGEEFAARVAQHEQDLNKASADAHAPSSPGVGTKKVGDKEYKVLDDGSVDVEGDVKAAAELLGAGEKVKLNQPHEVSTLLNELADRVNEAKKLGKDAPMYNLCDVSVPDTNLFCVESKGIPRIQMPQLSGVPLEGSKASKMNLNDKGEADLTSLFLDHLKEQGIGMSDETVPASHLRATQSELNGAKVAGMAAAMREGKIPEATLLASKDDYIVDGHHRWAAKVGNDAEDGKMGDETIPIQRIDMDIIPLLAQSLAFCEEYGLPVAGVGHNPMADKVEKKPKLQEGYDELMEAVGEHVPPSGARANAKRGLEMLHNGEAGDGLEQATVARARKIAKGEALTDEHVKRMHSFFERHDKTRPADGGSGASPWRTAWMLWGGDSGRRWAASVAKSLEAE